MQARIAQIRMQALLLSAVPLLFLVLLAVLSAWLVGQAERISSTSGVATRALSNSDTLLATVSAASREITHYVQSHDRASLASYRRAAAGFPAQERQFLTGIETQPVLRPPAQRYAAAMAQGMAVIERYATFVRGGDMAGARAYAQTPAVKRLGTEIETTKAAFDQDERTLALADLAPFSRGLRATLVVVLLVCVAGIAATLLAITGFGMRLVRRLEILATNVRRLGAGDDVEPMEGGDEIARVDRLFFETTLRLRRALWQKDELLRAYEREHQVASRLQQALLPQELPVIPGLRIEAAYAPAAKSAEIGGDWYDVFALSDRKVAIGVGDVAGHDLDAATAMGAVRQAIRIAAAEDPDPASVLRRVNRTLCAQENHRMVTAFFGVLDRSSGELRYAMAGHPPPFLVSPERDAMLLPGGGIALGINRRFDFTAFTASLSLGSALVLYTDGMVEAEHDYDMGMATLESVIVSETFSAGGNIAEQIQASVFSTVTPRDDAAVLFVGVTDLSAARGEPRRQRWILDAKDEAAAHRVRRALLWNLGEHAMPSSDFAAAEAIVGELLSNVARHTPGRAEIVLETSAEAATLTVSDCGAAFRSTGSQPPDVLAESGRGLFLIRALAQRFDVVHTGEGNRVTVVLPIVVASTLTAGAA